MDSIVFFAGYFFVSYLLLALCYLPVGKWLHFGKSTFFRAMLTVSLWALIAIAGCAIQLSIAAGSKANIMAFGMLAAGIAGEIAIAMGILGATMARAAAGWAILLVPRAILIFLALYFVRDKVFSAYRVPTVSMAPTFLPIHATATCPVCGGTVYFDLEPSALLPKWSQRDSTPTPRSTVTGTCVNCGKEISVSVASLTSLPADRFIVADSKLPQRWDLVAFRNASNIYLRRAVGLPGETLAIDSDGHILIDGKLIPGPMDNPTLHFPWPVDERMRSALRLHPGDSIALGAHQYFLIGDNSFESADSRITGPVMQTDIVGVVTLRYGPLSRFHVFR